MALTRPSFTQLTTTITSFTDPITVLHQGASTPDVDVGFLFNRANGLVSNVALYWSESAQSFVTAFTTNTGITNTNVAATSYANIKTGNITVNGIFWANGTVFSSGSGGGTTFTGGYVPNQSTFGANLVANSGVTSTSTTTGALVVAGGMGVATASYIGGNLTVGTGSTQNRANLMVFGGNLGATSGAVIPVAEFYTTNSNSDYLRIIKSRHAQGADWTTANTRIQQMIDVTPQGYIEFNPVGAIYGVAIGSGTTEMMRFAQSGNVVINTITTSTSTTTGALVVAGGIGAAGNLNVGGTFNTFSGNIGIGTTTQSGYKLDVSQSTNDTTIRSITTGAGAWLMTYDSTAYYSGVKHVGNNGARYWTTGMTNNSQTYTIAMDANGTTNRFFTIDTTGNIVISATTTSTSTTTGALVVKGGIGVAGQVTVGNVVTTGGVFWANGTVYSTGTGGGGTGLTYTAATTPPGGPNRGDIWYNTTTDVIYTYTYDGVSSYWLDLESTPILSTVAADAAGTAVIMGIALG